MNKHNQTINHHKQCLLLTDFQNFVLLQSVMKFATKSIRQYPPHLRHVAALPWDIQNSIT